MNSDGNPTHGWVIKSSPELPLNQSTDSGFHGVIIIPQEGNQHGGKEMGLTMMDGHMHIDRDDSVGTSTDEDYFNRNDSQDQSLTASPTPPKLVLPEPEVHTNPRVRFRSRVRIASGIKRHRKKRRDSNESYAAPPTGSSSRTSSFSSSIYAPLRSSTEHDAESPTQRVSRFSWQSRFLAMTPGMDNKDGKGPAPQSPIPPQNPEHSPLLAGPKHPSYTQEDEYDDVFDEEDDREEEDRLAREIDEVFGKWPGRLLNIHWWHWQVEPILCCICGDEGDD